MSKSNTPNYHIDKSVILFFVAVILVSASIFAYRFANHVPCGIVDFEFSANAFRVGEIIRFKDKTVGGTAIDHQWDFGDGEKIKEQTSPYHTYQNPGEYLIKLKVNGACETFKKITIKEKVFLLDSSKIARFEIPKTIKVGETLTVEDKSLNATSWEWRFGETANVNATKKKAEYVYQAPGLKTITLIVNGNPVYGTKKKINVLPKDKPKDEPVKNQLPKLPRRTKIKYAPKEVLNDKPKEAEEEKAPFIGRSEFELKLIQVSKKKAKTQDFDQYLCGNLNLPIIANKKKTSFIEFCQKIKGKNIKIKELELSYKDNNCIKNIVIRINKSLF